jgi:hypothetical protein
MVIDELPKLKIASEFYEEIFSIEIWRAFKRHANSEASLRFFKGIPDFAENLTTVDFL